MVGRTDNPFQIARLFISLQVLEQGVKNLDPMQQVQIIVIAL